MKKALIYLSAAILALNIAVGCRKAVKPEAPVTPPAATDPQPKKPARVVELQMVNFDFGSARLSEKARATLTANAEKIKEMPAYTVIVEGHCDQRGTVQYNLALGHKRAEAVKAYYTNLGLRAAEIYTTSYGEEVLFCMEETEACYAANRRAPTILRR